MEKTTLTSKSQCSSKEMFFIHLKNENKETKTILKVESINLLNK